MTEINFNSFDEIDKIELDILSLKRNNLVLMKLKSLIKKGEMAEWLKAHAWKVCKRETVSWVRIPLSPPFSKI